MGFAAIVGKIGVGCIDAVYPFPNITRHIQHAIGTSTARVVINRGGVLLGARIIEPGGIGACIAPRVAAGLAVGSGRAAGRLFLLGFAGQTPTCPAAKGLGICPTHVSDG